MVKTGRSGFTLVEAIVAMVLSTVLVILVGTTFMVQNRYYAVQVERSAAQDNARMVTDLISSELRSIMKGSVVTAGNKQLVVRSPMTLAVVCANGSGPKYSIHIEGGDTLIDVDEVSGVGVQEPLTGQWLFKDETWKKIYLNSNAAQFCAANGADTTSAGAEFHDIFKLNIMFGFSPPPGTVIMLYRTVEYSFATSQMDPTKVALFRRVGAGEAVEFATGMDASAQFLYRRAGYVGYATSVSVTDLPLIDAIRIEARARRTPQAVGVDDVTFGWGVNVILRNGP